MFKTLSIKNISKKYNQEVARHNSDVYIKKHLASYGLYDWHINNYSEEYALCFLIKYENNQCEEKKIVFAYKYNDKDRYSKYDYRPDIIIGGDIDDRSPEEAIYSFCSKYGEYLLNGYDIEEITKNDEENILNCTFEKQLSKKNK